MTSTRPDINFVIGKLIGYTSNPSMLHWQEFRRVLRYLNKTLDYVITYKGEPSILEGYMNASWISHEEDYSSTSGWVEVIFHGHP